MQLWFDSFSGATVFFSSLLFQLHEGPRVQGCYIGLPPGVLVLWIMFFEHVPRYDANH